MIDYGGSDVKSLSAPLDAAPPAYRAPIVPATATAKSKALSTIPSIV